ncbi:MAG TPA: chemotaxis protein CheA [Spirochaetes bacterium]|nr:chemotaxis protein CheA [Spirochaetota bacterium]
MGESGSIQEVFLKESAEILENLESDIVVLEEQWDQETINRVFRYIHTLKGGSGMAGYTPVYEFTHRLENLLDMVRSGALGRDRRLIDLLLDGMDWIRESLAGGSDDADMIRRRDALLKKAGSFHGGEKREEPAAAGAPVVAKAPEELEIGYRYFHLRALFREDIFESGIDPLMIMEDTVSEGAIVENSVIRKKAKDFKEFDPEKCYTGWDMVLKTKCAMKKLEDYFLFVMGDNDISIEDITDHYGTPSTEDKFLEERRIGEILVTRGILTRHQLDDALSAQDGNKKVGDLVVEKGYATEKDIHYALGEQERIKRKIETSTVRVDTGKLDSLLNLLGEIVIGQSAITRIADELDEEKSFRLKNALYGLDRITREFQEQIMSIRMIPIGPSFEKFRRFVRDTAHSLGKEIRIEIEGGETELDKTVIERIDDPLKHMIRNAIDHGIEKAEDRKKAGKDAAGKIILRAYHQEGNVYIEVRDDGRGIDRSAIRAKAESLGLLKPGEEAGDGRLFGFLFMPGFSTAEKVGDLSGRGVGMDVVRTNIESLRGSVEVETRPGEGSVFRVKLPLTMAIIEGMMVRVGKNVYIIPLLSIVESTRPGRDDIKTVKEQGEVVMVRGEYVTLVRLYKLFGIEADFTEPWDSLMVIVEAGMSRVGVMIDELLGQQQIVIKSLDNYLTGSRSVSGAAILGDGRVALIIDVHGLLVDIQK